MTSLNHSNEIDPPDFQETAGLEFSAQASQNSLAYEQQPGTPYPSIPVNPLFSAPVMNTILEIAAILALTCFVKALDGFAHPPK
jgi:hypothetical protein